MMSDKRMTISNNHSFDIQRPEWLTQIESVLEVLNEGALAVNENRQVLFANSRFLEMTGFSFSDFRGDRASLF